MGFNEYCGSFYPSGFPKWLIKITALAPLSKQYFIVGMVLLILVAFYTIPPFSGIL